MAVSSVTQYSFPGALQNFIKTNLHGRYADVLRTSNDQGEIHY